MDDKSPKRRWVLWALSLPFNLIVGWPWVLVMTVIFAAHQWKWEPGGVLTAVWRPWAANIWKYSTTLGHAIIYQPGASKRIRKHEPVHVRQGEDTNLRAFLLGLLVLIYGVSDGPAWALALGIWVVGYAWMATNFLSAWLRGGNPYRDSEHERSAYAQTDSAPDGMSWQDRQ